MKVEYVDHMGDDLSVVNAARVSFDKESEWGRRVVRLEDDPDTCYIEHILPEADEKLIGYLAKHNHWTPFSHCMITLRETVPIFVARQRFKHTVGFTYNEVSRRYVDDRPEFFMPDKWRKRPDKSIKQGSGDGEVEEAIIKWGHTNKDGGGNEYGYQEIIDICVEYYEQMLKNGIAPEQARMVLPQSMYTSYYVTGSLAAFARAYKLRSDNHSQKEIQELAKEWGGIIAPLFPVAWKVLTE
jgi:thymidylate synthase (FAD)